MALKQYFPALIDPPKPMVAPNAPSSSTVSATAFKGMWGYLDDFIARYLTPEDFLHVHLTIHQGNERLGYWMARAIEESGRAVAHFSPSGAMELLGNGEFDTPAGMMPYAATPRGLLVRLDKLPATYYHHNAHAGGLKRSAAFTAAYDELKDALGHICGQYGWSGGSLTEMLSEPSIITGARLSVFPERTALDPRTYQQTMRFALETMGAWDARLDEIRYSTYDNCLEHPPATVPYELLVPIIYELGGWIDFASSVGSPQFTVVNRDEKGIRAVINSMHLDRAKHADALSMIERSFIHPLGLDYAAKGPHEA